MTTRTRLCIVGPMTGLPEYNYPAFHAAASRLRVAGYSVTNPADNRLPEGAKWVEYMDRAIPQIFEAEGLALLPGYRSSNGARIEVAIARHRGIPIRTVDRWVADAELYAVRQG
ncbi:DUF4406 domain-containing protein [Arthrobacter sp. GCM10027362]|uniref:DUF4406 domain-containing protein n=1 Tax=Arthrobacter sp. GCM10027362 TaxID=3273379 RepID=UPI003628C875